MSEWPIFGLWLTCTWYITAPALPFFILINNNNNLFGKPPTCIYSPKTPEEITWGSMLFLFINRKIWFPVIKQIDVYLLRQKCWVDFLKFQTWSFLCLCQSCFIFSYNLHHHLLFLIIFNKLLPSFLALPSCTWRGCPGPAGTTCCHIHLWIFSLAPDAASANWVKGRNSLHLYGPHLSNAFGKGFGKTQGISAPLVTSPSSAQFFCL